MAARRSTLRHKNNRAALTLRLAGASYSEIADTVGFKGEVQARAAVVNALSVMDADPEAVNNLRSVDSARIERLLRGVWQKATSPNDPEHLPAAKMALNLIDRHIRLHGLDAPQEVVVYNPTAAEIDAWVTKVVADGGYEVLEGEVLEIEGA